MQRAAVRRAPFAPAHRRRALPACACDRRSHGGADPEPLDDLATSRAGRRSAQLGSARARRERTEAGAVQRGDADGVRGAGDARARAARRPGSQRRHARRVPLPPTIGLGRPLCAAAWTTRRAARAAPRSRPGVRASSQRRPRSSATRLLSRDREPLERRHRQMDVELVPVHRVHVGEPEAGIGELERRAGASARASAAASNDACAGATAARVRAVSRAPRMPVGGQRVVVVPRHENRPRAPQSARPRRSKNGRAAASAERVGPPRSSIVSPSSTSRSTSASAASSASATPSRRSTSLCPRSPRWRSETTSVRTCAQTVEGAGRIGFGSMNRTSSRDHGELGDVRRRRARETAPRARWTSSSGRTRAGGDAERTHAVEPVFASSPALSIRCAASAVGRAPPRRAAASSTSCASRSRARARTAVASWRTAAWRLVVA